MSNFGKQFEEVRSRNGKALAAFGTSTSCYASSLGTVVYEGQGPTVYTIGYERRDPEDLIASLRNVGVDFLLDVRERPFSRVAAYRKQALSSLCNNSGIAYANWAELGSTKQQRDRLGQAGDINRFMTEFERHIRRSHLDDLEHLQELVAEESVALFCYERAHNECHRHILCQYLIEECDATVIALL